MGNSNGNFWRTPKQIIRKGCKLDLQPFYFSLFLKPKPIYLQTETQLD